MKLICFPSFKLIILDKATLFETFKDIFATAEAYDRFATVVYEEVGWFFLLVSETYKDYMLSSAALRWIVLGCTRS
jgi:hypothetical protein